VKQKLSARDVLSDIEFELIQSAVSHDDLGQAIQAVRRYQNQAREEILETAHPKSRSPIARLLQINDMLIVLVQELAAAVQSLRLDLRRMGLAPHETAVDLSPLDRDILSAPPAPEMAEQTVEIENVMRREVLGIGMEARPVAIPLVGRLLQRLRIAVHGLALFYTNILAERQTVVNQTYGEVIIQLLQLSAAQQRQIETLDARIASLETRQTVNDPDTAPDIEKEVS